MIVREGEKGTALLSVLLLVAVMATVAATALERVRRTTQLAGNARAAAQAQLWLASAELLSLTRIEDLKAAADGRVTLAGNWLDVPRTVALPDGTSVVARVRDGGNCFNLNALARKLDQTVLASRPEGVREFEALMIAVGTAPTKARTIAAAAADYIDDDDVALPGGAERGAYPPGAVPANRPMADKSELRSLPGMTAADYARIERWTCALPVIGASPINVNTLRPEEAPLLAMLSAGALSPAAARDLIARRPPSGFASAQEVAARIGEAGAQLSVDTSFFLLSASVGTPDDPDGGIGETALIDASATPARVLWRQREILS